MSAPAIWIFFPATLAIIFWFLQRRGSLLPPVFATITSALLAAFAAFLPIGKVIQISTFAVDISTTLVVFGRRFVISSSDQPILVLIYVLGAFWFAGSRIARTPGKFTPLALGMISILVASLSVEPFLYSALLVEMAVLISIPLLVTPGKPVRIGLLRYLIFQTLGMPFILLAGWILSTVEISPSREVLLQQAALLLGLGFAFWLAVFPFYSWIPLLAGETSPYLAGFILSLLPSVVLFLALDFLNGLTWLRSSDLLYTVLQLTGLLMVVTGGIWAAFQQDLSRMFGYAVIFETGFALLALSTRSAPGLEVFATAFLPRLLTLALWSLALTILRNHGLALHLSALQGAIRKVPFAAIALVFACFSLGGLPLMGSFPVRQGLLEILAQQNISTALWTLLGSIGFLFSGFRILSIFVFREQHDWVIEEDWPQRLLLAGGLVALLFIGWFPRETLAGLLQILEAFPNLRF